MVVVRLTEVFGCLHSLVCAAQTENPGNATPILQRSLNEISASSQTHGPMEESQ